MPFNKGRDRRYSGPAYGGCKGFHGREARSYALQLTITLHVQMEIPRSVPQAGEEGGGADSHRRKNSLCGASCFLQFSDAPGPKQKW